LIFDFPIGFKMGKREILKKMFELDLWEIGVKKPKNEVRFSIGPPVQKIQNSGTGKVWGHI
jgi:hypothetical protein